MSDVFLIQGAVNPTDVILVVTGALNPLPTPACVATVAQVPAPVLL